MFLKNAWYVAAQSDAIGKSLTSLKILGEDILFYRNTIGDVVALEDACPHRKLPLSMGRLLGDTVQCGYHGLTFDCSGRCVNAPPQPVQPMPSPAEQKLMNQVSCSLSLSLSLSLSSLCICLLTYRIGLRSRR